MKVILKRIVENVMFDLRKLIEAYFILSSDIILNFFLTKKLIVVTVQISK